MGLGGLGMWEMIMIFLVVLLLFGAKRLPEIGSSLGKGIREFKGSIKEIEKEVKAIDEPERDEVPPTSASQDEADEGPRRLTTSPGPDSVGHHGGVPTQEAAGGEGPEESGAEESESEESDSRESESQESGSEEKVFSKDDAVD